MAMFVRRCIERGYSLEEVQPCVVSQDGESVTVDETHPSYPHVMKPGTRRISVFTTPTDGGPSLLTKAKNFIAAGVQHAAAGSPKASNEEIDRRFAICTACEFYDGKACTQCGCPLSREKRFLSKLAWADQECPVGKWGKASPQS